MSSKGAKGLSHMSKALRDANEGTFALSRPARTAAAPARLGMVRYNPEEALPDEALEEALGQMSDDDDEDEPRPGNKRSRGSGKPSTPGRCGCGCEHSNVNKATGKLTKYCRDCLKKALWANVRNGMGRTTQLDPQFVLDNIDEVVAEAKKNARATLDAQAEAAAQAKADAEARQAQLEAEAKAARESAAANLAAAQARRAEADAARAAAEAAYRAAIEAEHEAALAAATA